MGNSQQRQMDNKNSVLANTKRRMTEHGHSESTTLTLPEGTPEFYFKSEDPIKLDILPYRVGKNNPHADEGTLHWERTYWAHRVGKNGRLMVCPNWTSKGKNPCPICEYRDELRSQPDASKDLIKALRASERQLFNVIDMADPKKQIRVFDVSNYLFGAQIDSKLQNADDDDKFLKFAELVGGQTLKFALEKQTQGSNSWFIVTDINNKDRLEDYDEDILDRTYCLDELLKIPAYEELREAFESGEVSSKEETKTETKTAPAQSSKATESAPASTSTEIAVGSQVEWEDDKGGKVIGRVLKIKGEMTIVEDDQLDEHKIALDELKPAQKDKPKEKPKESPKAAAPADEGMPTKTVMDVVMGSRVFFKDEKSGDKLPGTVLKIKGEIAIVEDNDLDEHKVSLDELELQSAAKPKEKEKPAEQAPPTDEIAKGKKVKWKQGELRMEGTVLKVKGDVAIVEDNDLGEHKVSLDDLKLIAE